MLLSEEGEALVFDAPIHEQLPSRLEAEVALQVEYGDPRLRHFVHLPHLSCRRVSNAVLDTNTPTIERGAQKSERAP